MPVVTELVIDSAKAVSGSADYSRAMDAASSAAQRGLGAISDFATQAKNSITNLGSAAASMGPSLSTMAIGVTAAAAAFMAGFEAIKKMTAGLAEMGLSARRANLDVEVFQKLQFATGVGGVSNKDFLSGAEKLASNLSEALRSENDMSKLLDANNVKWKDGNKLVLDTNGLLNVARDLIHRAGDEQQKIKMAEMLGLTKDWVPALDKSAQAFAGLQEEASALGLVISRDTIEKAKQFDDEWRKSSEVFSTWMKSKLADLLPLLDILIEKAKQFAESVLGTLDKMANSPGGQEFTARTNRANVISEMFSVDNDTAENVRLSIKYAKALAGTLDEVTTKALDQEVALKSGAKFWNDFAASMAGAAAAGEQLTKSLPTGANDNKVKPSVLPDKDEANATKDALDRSIESVKRHTALTIANTDALGLGAGALAEFRTQAELVEAAERAGIDVTQKWQDRFDDLAADAAEANDELAKMKVASQIDWNQKTMGLSDREVKIARELQGIYGNDVPKALQSSEAATLRLQMVQKDMFDVAKQGATDFTSTLVDGLLTGANMMDTLNKALDNLIKGMANAAIRDLMNGNLEKAAVEAAIAGMAALGKAMREMPDWAKFAVAAVAPITLLGSLGKEPEDKALIAAQKAWADMNKEMQSFVDTANGLDLSGPGEQLVSLREQFDKLFVAAGNAHDPAGQAAASDALARSARRVVDAFANADDSLTEGAKQIATLKQQAAGMVEVLNRNGGMELNAQVFAGLARQIAAIQATIAKGLGSDINSAGGKGFLNDLTDLITKKNQLLSEGNVSSSLVSTWFDAMTQKVVDDAGLVGDSFNDLLKTFPNLSGVVHESTDALQKQADAQKQLADEQAQAFKSLSKDVNDFITSLKFGDKSTLTKTQQFEAAQSDFTKQAALALAKDPDATGSITKYADTYLTQARSYLGPSAAFGSVSDQVIATLQQILSANKPAGMLNGGLVGSYLNGGMVGNGIFNVDSVLARYAGGGQIALAGREYVMPAPQTAANFGTLEAMRAGRGPANDNSAVVAELRAMRADYSKGMSALQKLLFDSNMTDEQVLKAIKDLRTDQNQTDRAEKIRAKAS